MAEEGKVIAIHSQEQWTAKIEEAGSSKKLVVIDFTATWCGPCRFISPILDEIAKKLPNVIFLKVDVDEMKSIAEEFSVEAMPTFVLMKEGKVVDKVVGAAKEELSGKIAKHSATACIAE
ncbi:hypothetical protein ACQJBY_003336 [Aegilops geniculata]